MTDIFLYAGEASPNDVKLRDPTTSGGGGASLTATIVVTLDGITAALAATLGHPATESATLDGVTFGSTGTVGHPITSAVTLDDVAFASSATVTHTAANLTATIDVLLDGIGFDATAESGQSQPKQGGAPRKLYLQAQFRGVETEDQKRLRREASGIIARAKNADPSELYGLVVDAEDISGQLQEAIAQLEVAAEAFTAELRAKEAKKATIDASLFFKVFFFLKN